MWSVGADLGSYAVTLQDAAVLLRTKGREAAEAALEPMARQMWMGRVRSARGTKPEEAQGQPGKASDSDRAFVFLRDGFQCRLCGGRCVPRNVLVAFHHVFPDLIPYNRNYKRGETHPVYWWLAPEADHVIPRSIGGTNDPAAGSPRNPERFTPK